MKSAQAISAKCESNRQGQGILQSPLAPKPIDSISPALTRTNTVRLLLTIQLLHACLGDDRCADKHARRRERERGRGCKGGVRGVHREWGIERGGRKQKFTVQFLYTHIQRGGRGGGGGAERAGIERGVRKQKFTVQFLYTHTHTQRERERERERDGRQGEWKQSAQFYTHTHTQKEGGGGCRESGDRERGWEAEIYRATHTHTYIYRSREREGRGGGGGGGGREKGEGGGEGQTDPRKRQTSLYWIIH